MNRSNNNAPLYPSFQQLCRVHSARAEGFETRTNAIARGVFLIGSFLKHREGIPILRNDRKLTVFEPCLPVLVFRDPKEASSTSISSNDLPSHTACMALALRALNPSLQILCIPIGEEISHALHTSSPHIALGFAFAAHLARQNPHISWDVIFPVKRDFVDDPDPWEKRTAINLLGEPNVNRFFMPMDATPPIPLTQLRFRFEQEELLCESSFSATFCLLVSDVQQEEGVRPTMRDNTGVCNKVEIVCSSHDGSSSTSTVDREAYTRATTSLDHDPAQISPQCALSLDSSAFKGFYPAGEQQILDYIKEHEAVENYNARYTACVGDDFALRFVMKDEAGTGE